MKSKNFILLFIIFSFIFFPLIVEAKSEWISGTTNYDSDYGRRENSAYKNPNPYYVKGDCFSEDGMYSCISESLYRDENVHGIGLHTDENNKKIYYYDSGRVDVWGENGGWLENSTLQNHILYPGMDLKYKVTTLIPTAIRSQNITGIEVKKINFNDIKYDENILNDVELTADTKSFWNDWKANNYTISDYGIDGDNFYYTVTITDLAVTNQYSADNGLGYNGRTKPNLGDEYVYHYWIPYEVIFTYENENKTNNICLTGGIDPSDGVKKSAQRYAYDNPGTCCYEYPETCCGNYEFLSQNWNSTTWGDQLGALCCNDESEIQYDAYDIYGDNKLLPTIKTLNYKSYLNNTNLRNLYNEKCSNTCQWNNSSQLDYCCNYSIYKNTSRCKIGTNSCTSKSDYSYGNKCCLAYPNKYPNICTDPTTACTIESDYSYGNKCCQLNPNKYPNICKPITESCNDTNYFNNNLSTCCEEFSNNEDKYREKANICCFVKDTTGTNKNTKKKVCGDNYENTFEINSNATCITNYNKIQNNNSTDISDITNMSTYYTNDNNIKISEDLSIMPSNGTNDIGIPKINIQYGGGSFEYNLDIYSKISLYGGSVDSIMNNGSQSCDNMKSKFLSYKDQMENTISEINNSNGNNGIININNDNNYEYNISNEKNGGEEESIKVYASDYDCIYDRVCYTTAYGGTICYDLTHPLSYEIGNDYVIESITYKYKYTASLPTCYLKHGSETLGCARNKENQVGYYSVGNSYYVKETESIGVHDININVINGGITGKVNSSSNGETYTCQHEVTNEPTPNICTDPTDLDCCELYNTCPPKEEPELFRPISLITPFPNNRTIGANWLGISNDNTLTKSEKYITNNGDSVYSEPIYSIRLTPYDIQQIKDYNNHEDSNGGYNDWNTMATYEYNSIQRTSNFLTSLSNGGTVNSFNFSKSEGNIILPNLDDRKYKTGELNEYGTLGG